MAAGAEVNSEAAAMVAPTAAESSPITVANNADETVVVENNGEMETKGSDSNPEFQMQEMTEIVSKLKLNPLAEEFFPSSYTNRDQMVGDNSDGAMGSDGFRRRRNSNQGKKRFNGKAFRAEREDSIKRTVYVSDVDHNVTEEELAAVFGDRCGEVVDCRVCGDPHSRLRFAFVELADERAAREALQLCGTVIGLYPVKVLPSKTAILPVNPIFLPRSEDEREMCARTVYCTNIDKLISHAEIRFFFESCCGPVTRLRLLGDYVHSTRIAFVEFAMAGSAIAALSFSGTILGTQPIRVSPSKTPVRPRAPRSGLE